MFRNITLMIEIPKLLDLSYSFGVIESKIIFFLAKSAHKISKTISWIKKFYKYDPPKVGVSEAKPSFRAFKKSFLKKSKFCDLTEHWVWSPRWSPTSCCECQLHCKPAICRVNTGCPKIKLALGY